MESVFLNVARGNRISNYMGLHMVGEHTYRYAPDYTYVEIPLLALEKQGEEVEKGLRNQHIKVVPACRVDVKGGYKILVKVNPELQEFGDCPSVLLLDSHQSEQASFYITLRKDLEKHQITWAVRLYLLM